MRVRFSEVGHVDTDDEPTFNATVDLDAVPREGEIVTTGDGRELYVRTVVWRPVTNSVYIVVGPRRPQ